jgi:hypothetical protein
VDKLQRFGDLADVAQGAANFQLAVGVLRRARRFRQVGAVQVLHHQIVTLAHNKRRRAVRRAYGRTAKALAAHRAHEPCPRVRLIMARYDMRMAQVRQVKSLAAKLRQSFFALATVAIRRGQHMQLFNSDKVFSSRSQHL